MALRAGYPEYREPRRRRRICGSRGRRTCGTFSRACMHDGADRRRRRRAVRGEERSTSRLCMPNATVHVLSGPFGTPDRGDDGHRSRARRHRASPASPPSSRRSSSPTSSTRRESRPSSATAAGGSSCSPITQRCGALSRWGGTEHDTAGDGFFASFVGPARAIHCAHEIAEDVIDLGIETRAGVHIGECEVIDGKPGGLAVTIGARLLGTAGPREVVVSETVKDLVAGSGFSSRIEVSRT